MKRALLLLTAFVALYGAACSGGGSTTPPPPPPPGPFKAASLNGQYAFSMSGSEAATTNGAAANFFTRAGTFTANGAGVILGGVEDVNLITGSTRLAFTGGSYTINGDGRGTLSLVNSTGTLTFSITLTSTSGGLLAQMPPDGSATASGSFIKQTAAAFSKAGIANDYAFDFTGIDPAGNAESIVGHVHSDGAGSFTTGIWDDNDGGFTTPPTAATPITGTYAADSINPGDLAAFGRGVINIGGIQGAFYVVDQTRFIFIETSSGGAIIGSASLQSNVPTSTAGITGGFAFVMAGNAQFDPFVRGGRFSTSGGALSSILIDQNDAGIAGSFPTAGSNTSGTYTIDSNGTGRGTATFILPGAGSGAFTFVFYLTSPTQGVIQDQSPGVVADGTLIGQPATITNASLGGNYAFDWSGITSNEEDIIGQFKLATGSFTGNADLNEFGRLLPATGIPVTGTLALNGDGSGHNVFTINLQTNPANNNITFFAYVGNNNTILLISTQNVRVAAGVANFQP